MWISSPPHPHPSSHLSPYLGFRSTPIKETSWSWVSTLFSIPPSSAKGGLPAYAFDKISKVGGVWLVGCVCVCARVRAHACVSVVIPVIQHGEAWMVEFCCSVTKSCTTLHDPMDCSTPGSSVLNYLPAFAQIHVHWASDAIQPSHPLSSPSPSALNLPQHQGLFKWVSSLHAAAAAAKLLQSCLTLCDPRDGSPPGFPIPGILQARTLEWVAISFSNAWKWKVKVKSLSRIRL